MPEDESTGDEIVDSGGTDVSAGRRTLLRAIGGAAAVGALGSLSAAAPATAAEFPFQRVVNVVEDLGADPTGGRRIDGLLEDNAADGTLFEFPDGTYKAGRMSFGGVRNVGLRSVAEAAPTIRAPSGMSGTWIRFPNSRNVLLEGFTFDQRGSGTGGTISMDMPGSWVVRDVTKVGTHPHTEAGFRMGVGNSGATGLAERCVARRGAPGPNGVNSVGIFVPPNHAGDVTVRDCVIEHFSNNGLYGSAPGHGAGGAVRVERGLYRNNHVSSVRLGSSGSYAKGVIVVNDDRAPSGDDSGPTQRGFYLRQGGDDIVIENCDVSHSYGGAGGPFIIGGAADGPGAVRNCRIRNDTSRPAIYLNSSVAPNWSGSGIHLTGSGNLSAPSGWIACSDSGCESPQTEPRRGSTDDPDDGSTGGNTELPRTLVIRGDGVTRTQSYAFAVSGELRRSGDLGTLDSADFVSGNHAEGSVWGDGVDGYRFSGEVTDFRFDGPGSVFIDGTEVDPETLDAELPRTLVLRGDGVTRTQSYAFAVSGELVRSGDLGTLDDADAVEGNAAEGSVWGDGVDGYRFSGEITDFRFDGPGSVLLDGIEVDPETLGEDALPNVLTISGGSDSSVVAYALVVSERLEKSADNEATVDPTDIALGTAAAGTVSGDRDSYRFAGDISAFRVGGDLSVSVNGEAVDPDAIGSV